MTDITTNGEYNSDQIVILEWLEPVRQRPGMYIWSTSITGLHHMITEIVDNAIDESMAGHCHNITVTLFEDGRVQIDDDGRGIPTDIHPKTWKSALEAVFTILHAGGKFEKSAYKISWGLHGVGASVVNALSEELIVHVHRNGQIYEQKYRRWVPDGIVTVIWSTDKTGTTVRFLADALIFETTKYNTPVVFTKYRQTAYLCPWVTFTVVDKYTWRRERYFFQWWIRNWIVNLTEDQKVVNKPIYISWESSDIISEMVFCYTDSTNNNILSFVNNINTGEWWTHLLWFRDWLLKAVNEITKSKWHLDPKAWEFQPSDISDGLYGIIHVKIPNPQFEWQTKGKLGNSYVRKATDELTYSFLIKYFSENEKEFDNILEKIKLSAKARMAAKLARETVLRKTVIWAGVLPGKLSDCSSKDRSKTELFIIEWDSAGGTAKQGRDSHFQAILPLRGKILNTERANITNTLANNEVKSLITAIGIGIKDGIDMSRLRYDKVVIMTDADVDGSHIRTLLLTFFYRFMKPLIDEWHVYIAVPPLYKIYNGKKEVYIYDVANKTLEELARESWFDGKFEVQRYKGLWEMNFDQLADTTMNPVTRSIKQVTITDAEQSDKLFRILMGDDTDARKHFILSNAKNVRELDV